MIGVYPTARCACLMGWGGVVPPPTCPIHASPAPARWITPMWTTTTTREQVMPTLGPLTRMARRRKGAAR